MQAPNDLLKKYRVEIWLAGAGLCVLVCFAVCQRIILHGSESAYLHWIGAPLDDVFIHARFAQNLVRGQSYSFNPSETLAADTSPLWVLLLAIGSLLTSRTELIAIAISSICYIAISPGVYRIARDLLGFSGKSAVLAGILTVVSARLAWSGMSGMETALATLLMLLVVEEHIRSRGRSRLRTREGILLGLGLLVRPEFAFVAIVLIVDWALIAKKVDLSAAPLALIILALIASPAYLLPLTTGNSLVAHSSIVQGAKLSIIPNAEYLWFVIRILASNNLVLFVLIIAASVWLWKTPSANDRSSANRIMIIVAFGLPIVQAFVAPQFRHHGRYFFPVIPLLVLLGVSGWEELQSRYTLTDSLRKFVPILAVVAGIIETGRWSIIEAESVRNINDQHLAIAEWLRENMTASDTLAVDDVGAIGYYLNKPLIDLTGLMTPRLWPIQHDQDSVWRSARAQGANLFVIYRRLNPSFYEGHKDSLVLVQDFPVRLPLTSAADTVMGIYRIGTRGR
jgi:hypothetical protein